MSSIFHLYSAKTSPGWQQNNQYTPTNGSSIGVYHANNVTVDGAVT